MKTFKTPWVVPALFVLAATLGQAEIEAPDRPAPFLVLAGTNSPDGHFAVAWGLPKHPEIWAEVHRFARDHPPGNDATEQDAKNADEVFEKVASVAAEVENYLVDLRDGKIIHTMAHARSAGATSGRSRVPNYYLVAGLRPNRHDLEVVWSNAGDLVLVNHTYRWDCVTFCAIPLSDGRPGHELDLNEKLGPAVRRFVVKSSQDFAGSKSDLNIAFSNLEKKGDARFSVQADAVMGKEWSSDGAQIEFALTPSRKAMTIEVLAVRASGETR